MLVSVTDEGPGIKPTDLERMFEKFYRGGRADGRQAPAPASACRSAAAWSRRWAAASGPRARRSSGAARASSFRCRRWKRARSPRRPHERRARSDRRRRTANPALPQAGAGGVGLSGAARRLRPRGAAADRQFRAGPDRPRPRPARHGRQGRDRAGAQLRRRADRRPVGARPRGGEDRRARPRRRRLRREAVRDRRAAGAHARRHAPRPDGRGAEDARRGRRPDDRHGEAAGDPRGRRDQADAARIRPAVRARRQSRPGDDPRPDPHRRLGPGAQGRHAVLCGCSSASCAPRSSAIPGNRRSSAPNPASATVSPRAGEAPPSPHPAALRATPGSCPGPALSRRREKGFAPSPACGRRPG